MAREFVRSVKNVKDINTINDNITEENDLISDIDGNVYIRKKVGYQKLNVANDKDTNDIKKLNKKIDFLEYDLNGVKIDLSNYAKLSDIPENQDLTPYAKKTDLTPYTKKIDVINWQKYKLTEENGDRIRISNVDPITLKTGFYQMWNVKNAPYGGDNNGQYWNVDVVTAYDNIKQITATTSYDGRMFKKNIHKGEDRGWKEITSNTIESRVNSIESKVNTIEKDYKEKIAKLEERLSKLENPTTE